MSTAIAVIILWDMPPLSVREYFAMEGEWNQARSKPKGSSSDRLAYRQKFAERCLQLAAKYPNSSVELAILMLADEMAADTLPGHKASELLRSQIAAADMDRLARAISRFGMGRVAMSLERAVPEILTRVKRDLEHPKAARTLASIIGAIGSGSETKDAPPHFAEIAELIVSRYPDSPEIYNFCEVLGPGYSCPRWAPEFEEHVNRILEVNKDRWVRCTASMALAQIAMASNDRQQEAEERYRVLIEEFGGEVNVQWQNVVRHRCDQAKVQLEAMQFASIGKPAPEIEGMDLSGKSMTLSEYRGKVVLITYWATWCYPCMKLVPHERELADHYASQPFAIVGVNADDDPAIAVTAETEKKITWRSFRDKRDGAKTISNEWKALFPTVYLIDHNGIVRQRYCGAPSPDVMKRAVGELVAAAIAN